MVDKTKIAIQRIISEDVKTAVFTSLDNINAQKLMQKEGMIILIKPNLLMGKPPERGVNTHPEVVRATIQWVKRFNPAKIYVCDSAGGAKVGITEKAILDSGIGIVCEEEGAECLPFEKSERKIYKIEDPLE